MPWHSGYGEPSLITDAGAALDLIHTRLPDYLFTEHLWWGDCSDFRQGGKGLNGDQGSGHQDLARACNTPIHAQNDSYVFG